MPIKGVPQSAKKRHRMKNRLGPCLTFCQKPTQCCAVGQLAISALGASLPKNNGSIDEYEQGFQLALCTKYTRTAALPAFESCSRFSVDLHVRADSQIRPLAAK